jgi:hypothetical protein
MEVESEKAYQAFIAYRNLGPDRTVAEAAGVAQKGQGYVRHWWLHWASRYLWVARADAWDDHLHAAAEEKRFEKALGDRLAKDEAQRLRAETTAGQLQTGQDAGAKFLAKLSLAFLPKDQGGTGELVRMKPERMLPHVGKVAALFLGCIKMRLELERGVQPEETRIISDQKAAVAALAQQIVEQIEKVPVPAEAGGGESR